MKSFRGRRILDGVHRELEIAKMVRDYSRDYCLSNGIPPEVYDSFVPAGESARIREGLNWSSLGGKVVGGED